MRGAAGDDGGVFRSVACEADAGLAATDRAAVVVRTPDGAAAFEVVAPPEGTSGAFTVAVGGTGRCRAVFVVWTAARSPGDNRSGTASLLRIANVRARATRHGQTSPGLAPLHLDALPVSIDALSGHLLRTVAPPRDCDADGIPDVVVLSLLGGIDKNGDGIPDACSGRTSRVNWVLLAMGAVLVAVSLRRFRQSHWAVA